jgi:hypothetical protein
MKTKRFGAAIILGLVLIAVAYAGDEMMTGYVLKLEKESITVEDSETGKEIKVKFDKKTRIIGKLEEDIFVEVETKDKRAVSIKVVEGEEGLDGLEDEENKGDEKSGGDKSAGEKKE